MSDPVVVRPTARLVGIGAGLVVLGVLLLVVGWAVDDPRAGLDVTSLTAPLGWLAVLAGIVVSIWAAVRRAQNRDALQAQQAQRP